MPLRLTYFGDTTIPVEVEGLTPDWTCDKSLAEIERFEIFHGNRKLPLAEMFKVDGDASDRNIHFEGNLFGVHWIGAHMSSGSIHVDGPAGRHVGSQMRGGQLLVTQDVRDWLGTEMRGGLIHVRGNAGNVVGGGYRGSTRGMTGGRILVDGNAGHEIGHTMRRGLIAIGGSAGDMLAFNMIAGTVLVFGDCGVHPGAGMKRGTLALMGSKPPQLLPSFRYAATYQPQFVPLILRDLMANGFRVDPSLLSETFDLHHGDLVSLGKGEVLFRARKSIANCELQNAN